MLYNISHLREVSRNLRNAFVAPSSPFGAQGVLCRKGTHARSWQSVGDSRRCLPCLRCFTCGGGEGTFPAFVAPAAWTGEGTFPAFAVTAPKALHCPSLSWESQGCGDGEGPSLPSLLRLRRGRKRLHCFHRMTANCSEGAFSAFAVGAQELPTVC